MARGAVPHNLGDYLHCFSEWFHSASYAASPFSPPAGSALAGVPRNCTRLATISVRWCFCCWSLSHSRVCSRPSTYTWRPLLEIFRARLGELPEHDHIVPFHAVLPFADVIFKTL